MGTWLGVGHSLVDKAADCAYHLAPGLWLQTGPCMPYGPWLRVATHLIIDYYESCIATITKALRYGLGVTGMRIFRSS